MGSVLGDIFLYGLGIAIGPLPILVVVLLLTGNRGQRKSLAYLLGWLLGLVLLVGFVVWVVGNYDFKEGGEPSLVMSWARIGAGVVLLAFAVVSWWRRPPPYTIPELPKWLHYTHQTPILLALGVGLFFGLISLKNFIFTAAAAASIARAQLDLYTSLICSALFIGVATIGVGVPIGVAFLNKRRADEILAYSVNWLSRHNTLLVCLITLLVGVKLLLDGWREL